MRWAGPGPGSPAIPWFAAYRLQLGGQQNVEVLVLELVDAQDFWLTRLVLQRASADTYVVGLAVALGALAGWTETLSLVVGWLP